MKTISGRYRLSRTTRVVIAMIVLGGLLAYWLPSDGELKLVRSFASTLAVFCIGIVFAQYAVIWQAETQTDVGGRESSEAVQPGGASAPLATLLKRIESDVATLQSPSTAVELETAEAMRSRARVLAERADAANSRLRRVEAVFPYAVPVILLPIAFALDRWWTSYPQPREDLWMLSLHLGAVLACSIGMIDAAFRSRRRRIRRARRVAEKCLLLLDGFKDMPAMRGGLRNG